MALSRWLQYWQGWDNNHLARKIVPVFEHSHCKQILPNDQSELPWYSFMLFLHVLLSVTREKTSASSFKLVLLRKSWRAVRLPLSLLFSTPGQPNCLQPFLTGHTGSSCWDSAELLHPSLYLFPELVHLRFRTQYISSLIFTSLIIVPVLQLI